MSFHQDLTVIRVYIYIYILVLHCHPTWCNLLSYLVFYCQWVFTVCSCEKDCKKLPESRCIHLHKGQKQTNS
ncbi:hypothetical protein BD408DRAFT_169868 [Parasitella parasitica]|nr:hypothetical protein BD408DRAFT_169868 [Parasitella parasitica]